MGARLDPEHPLSFYDGLRNLLPRMSLSWEGKVPLHLDGYTNMYPLLNRFTNNLHVFACQTIIRWDGRWPVFMLVALF